eukprot:125479_1
MADHPALAYCGGFVLGICLLPQIYQAISTKSTDDISFLWQFLYFTGMLLLTIYAVAKQDPALYIPFSFELMCVITLICCKLKFDVWNKWNQHNQYEKISNDNDADDNNSDIDA